MSWRYSVVKRGKEYAIHEVYFSETGKIVGITDSPVAAQGDSPKEVIKDLEAMLRDAKRWLTIDGSLEEGKWKKRQNIK